MLVRAAVAVLAWGALALAQNAGMPGSNGQSNPGSNQSGGSTANPPDPGRAMRAMLRATDTMHSGSNETIGGRVILSDGGEAGAGILVQRVCGTRIQEETRTDSKGGFIVARSVNRASNADVSSQDEVPGVWGCELRVTASGYMTASVPLANGGAEGAQILILLHRGDGLHDMTISAANLLAPKAARKAYEKGLDEERRHSPDRAQQALLDAVKLYPRYPAAWLELGKVYEQRGHHEEARDAYTKSIAADGEYLFPYERQYRLSIHELRWQEAADFSEKVLRLDPYEFPQAYYFNAVANLELDRLDEAERSAREAAKLEGAQAEPRGNYLLGMILWRKGDLDGATDKLQAFLATQFTGAEQASAQRALTSILRQRERRSSRN